MKALNMKFGILVLLFGSLILQGQGVPQDKTDPINFPLQVKSSTLMKPKIMSLVVEVKGDKNRFLSNEESFTLIPGRLIPSKGLFIVPLLSRVIFRPMPGITTLVGADTKLQVKSLEVVKRRDKVSKRKAFLFLNEGSVFTSIQKLNHKTTIYEIQTPQAIASAKGTKFWVHYRNGKGKIGVVNGVVEVRLTNGIKLSLKQDQFIELEGIGPTLSAGAVRFPTLEEQTESEEASQAISKVEGVTSSASNPFLVTSEALGSDDFYLELLPDPLPLAVAPNPSNTSSNMVVSPVGP